MNTEKRKRKNLPLSMRTLDKYEQARQDRKAEINYSDRIEAINAILLNANLTADRLEELIRERSELNLKLTRIHRRYAA